jgi:hypothetical protein
MQISKSALIDLLRTSGQAHHVSTVDRDLPDRVDTDEYAQLLNRLGVTFAPLADLPTDPVEASSDAVDRSRETGGLGGFGGPGASVTRLNT